MSWGPVMAPHPRASWICVMATPTAPTANLSALQPYWPGRKPPDDPQCPLMRPVRMPALSWCSMATLPRWVIVGMAVAPRELMCLDTARTSTSLAWLRKVSQHPLLVLRMAPLSTLLPSTTAKPTLPTLLHRDTQPSWLRMLLMPSFH